MTEIAATAAEKPVDPTPQEVWDSMSLLQQRAAVFRVQWGRETAEAFVVAFILALLFRAFIAEAFVIPTGSMAPALMGAHKDVFCDQCGQQFPIGASLENRTPVLEDAVVGGICPNCRHVNSLDLQGTPDDGTFSGDRILVSKFAYAISEPKRWDVIVFKVPVNPKQNYIKRLVGLPNETLTIRHGDVYARSNESRLDAEQADSESKNSSAANGPGASIGGILRKPPAKLLAMTSPVYDSDHQATDLVAAAYPSRLQPWREGAKTPPQDSWSVRRSDSGLTAEVNAEGEQPQWLRYYHRWPSPRQWSEAKHGKSLQNVNPYDSRLITDFYPYDAYLYVPAERVYDVKPRQRSQRGRQSILGRVFGGNSGVFRPGYESGESLRQFNGYLKEGGTGYASEGAHWVGDLIVQADVETAADTQILTLEIVEAGVRYRCDFDLSSGRARLSIDSGQMQAFDSPSDGSQNLHPIAETAVRAGSRHEIRLSNCDDELLLWVDGDVVPFDTPTTFESSRFRSPEQSRPYYDGPGNPLDASPVGIAVQGGFCTLRHLSIERDKYYIANNKEKAPMLDYDLAGFGGYDNGATARVREIQAVMAEPELWDEFPGWAARRSVSFPLAEDQFFPMGDNSPESLDARCWAGSKVRFGRDRSVDDDAYLYAEASYVPRDLLVGKALAIFWPHPWRTPVPFTPNFQRMRLIR